MFNSIARGVGTVGVSIKNIVYFLLFIGVILFLFFIPEILKLDWSRYTGVSSVSRTVTEEREVFRSPLDEVIERINSGYYDPAPAVSEQSDTEGAKKTEPLRPFDPKARIIRLEVIKIDPSPGQRTAVTNLQITGVVEGDDIKRIELFRNGNHMGQVPLDRPNAEGKREFYISKPKATGVWTIHIEDSKKRVYQKSYRFFPAIERFPRENGVYQLRHGLNGLDPKIERLFVVGEYVPGRPNPKAFVEF